MGCLGRYRHHEDGDGGGLDDAGCFGAEPEALHAGAGVGGDGDESGGVSAEVRLDSLGRADGVVGDVCCDGAGRRVELGGQLRHIGVGVAVGSVTAPSGCVWSKWRRERFGDGEDAQLHIERGRPLCGDCEHGLGGSGPVDAGHQPGHGEGAGQS